MHDYALYKKNMKYISPLSEVWALRLRHHGTIVPIWPYSKIHLILENHHLYLHILEDKLIA